MREAHGGALEGHFSVNKTIEILKEHFYWPWMANDVNKVVPKCAYVIRARAPSINGCTPSS